MRPTAIRHEASTAVIATSHGRLEPGTTILACVSFSTRGSPAAQRTIRPLERFEFSRQSRVSAHLGQRVVEFVVMVAWIPVDAEHA